MPLYFSDEDPQLNPIRTDSEVPEHLQQHTLHGWNTNYQKGKKGEWVTQYRTGHNYELCDYFFRFEAPCIVFPVIPRAMITVVFVLRGSFECLLAGAGIVPLQQGTSYLFYLPQGGGHEARFNAINANIFHVVLEKEYLDRLCLSNPSIARLLEQLNKQSVEGIQEQGTRIPFESLGKIEGIKSFRGSAHETNMYTEAEIIHLLLNYSKKLEDADDYGKLSQWQMDEKIKRAKEFIDLHTGRKYYRKTIANHVGLNVQYLGRFFKKKYGFTIEGYQQHVQFKRAIHLLLQTDEQIISIAIDLGYKDEQGFIRIFKKKFEITPLQYRLQFRKKMD